MIENCSCHINPPCSACVDAFECTVCYQFCPNDLAVRVNLDICVYCFEDNTEDK